MLDFSTSMETTDSEIKFPLSVEEVVETLEGSLFEDENIEEVGMLMVEQPNIAFSEDLVEVINSNWTECLVEPTENILTYGGSISINEARWISMNKDYGRSAVKRLISRAIDDHELPMPLQPISEHNALSLFNKLKNEKASGNFKKGKVFNRFPYKWDVSDYYINASSTHNPASNFFHQYNRWLAGSNKHASPFEAWTETKHHNTFLNGLWSMKHKKVSTASLNSVINLKIYVASQFKPQAARTFYDLFNAKHVLDMSSGWGDRLCGFCASNAESYVGLDPNTRLIKGYQAQKEMYGRGKDITMVTTGSEVYDPGKRKFDTAFTSPPYFALEEYSKDEGQSYMQHDTFTAWCDKFFFPTLDMVWKALDDSDPKRGGIVCVNISDIITDGNHHDVCDRLNKYMSKKKGARYVGCIGLRLSLRPNITNDEEHFDAKEDAAFVEPMWIWAKGGTWNLEEYIENGFKGEVIEQGLFDL